MQGNGRKAVTKIGKRVIDSMQFFSNHYIFKIIFGGLFCDHARIVSRNFSARKFPQTNALFVIYGSNIICIITNCFGPRIYCLGGEATRQRKGEEEGRLYPLTTPLVVDVKGQGRGEGSSGVPKLRIELATRSAR